MNTRNIYCAAAIATLLFACNTNLTAQTAAQVIRCANSYGGSLDDFGSSIRQTNDGKFIVTENSSSGDGEAIENHGGDDYRVMKLTLTPPIISSPQFQALPNLLCGTQEFDTLWVHNTGGSPLVIYSDSLTRNNTYFSIVSPIILPDSIAVGDSLPFIISFFPYVSGVPFVGSFGTTLYLYSNDTASGHYPWTVAINARKDSIGFNLEGLNNDTLDFGMLDCGATKDESFSIFNLSSVQTSFTPHSGNPLLFVVNGITDSSSYIIITVHFTGGISGTSIVPLFITDTCGKTDTVYMKAVVHGISVALAQKDTTICGAGIVDLASPGVYASYRWSDGEITPSISVTKSGAYSLTVVDNNGCSATSNTVNVTFVPLPVPTITSIGSLSFCTGDSVILSAASGYASYIWSDGETSQNITVRTPDALKVTVTNAAGCTGVSQSVIVSVGDSLAPVIAGASGFCPGNSTTLDAGGGYDSYQWSTGATTETISVNTPGQYSVRVKKGGCAGTSVAMNVVAFPAPAPSITASGALSFCKGDSVILYAPSGYASYLWSDGETTQDIIVKQFGTYSVTVTNANGCAGSSAPASVTAGMSPDVQITSPPTIPVCPNESVSGQATIHNYSADTQSLSLSGGASPLFGISLAGVTLAPGDSEQITITFQGSPDTGIYTAYYAFVDACGGAHNGTMTVHVGQLPPVLLTMQPDSTSMLIGGELKVYMLANPVSSISTGISFTVANEPTALHLESVSSPCSVQITKNNDSAAITISACPQLQNDTIATLYYQTLIGYTTTPYIRLQNVSTTNTCDTVEGMGNNTIMLSLSGCDLGQAVVTDYSTSINSVYPNPNNGIATVQYTTVEKANVTLSLCDEIGRTVQTIVNTQLMPGTYTTEFSLNSIINGVYFLTMQEGKYYTAREVWVLK